MSGGSEITLAAARVWGDPAVRAQIVEMHQQGVPLVEMTERVGLGPALGASGLRDVVAGLDPTEVGRCATRSSPRRRPRVRANPGASFPVDCCVDDPAAGVRLVAQPTTAGATAPVVRVERA